MDAYICSALRTPFGRYGGSLASVRTDDLAAMTIRALVDRHPSVDWSSLDDVVVGCANQAGEDNRNVARMAVLLAGLPQEVPGTTVNRLCGSSLDAIAIGARAIRCGEAALVLAGGVEGMSRAPFVMGKAESPFSRSARLEDTTMGPRFVNPALQSKYGADTMPETAENVAAACGISRESQDAFAYRSQQRAAAARKCGWLAAEIATVQIPAKKGESVLFAADEHPRPDTTMEGLSKLKPIVRSDGTVTAGNASGLNDGAAMLVLASERAANGNGLTPLARVVASAVAGVAPRVMGMGPVPATRRVLAEGWPVVDRPRHRRTERSVRRASSCCLAGTWSPRGCTACQSQRRRHRDRAPAGRERRTARHHGRSSVATDRRAVCALHHVYRRRAGHRDHPRACVAASRLDCRKLMILSQVFGGQAAKHQAMLPSEVEPSRRSEAEPR